MEGTTDEKHCAVEQDAGDEEQASLWGVLWNVMAPQVIALPAAHRGLVLCTIDEWVLVYNAATMNERRLAIAPGQGELVTVPQGGFVIFRHERLVGMATVAGAAMVETAETNERILRETVTRWK